MKWGSVTALGIALLAAGCENVSGPAAPELAPQASSRVVVVQEKKCDVGSSVSATIGENGGELKLCMHKLIVPGKAVKGPTEFRMTKESSEIAVRLTATSVGSTVENDVGSSGFQKPLTLSLNWKEASGLPADLSTLGVYWNNPAKGWELQKSVVNTDNKSVTAYPNHFSIYGIGWPD